LNNLHNLPLVQYRALLAMPDDGLPGVVSPVHKRGLAGLQQEGFAVHVREDMWALTRDGISKRTDIEIWPRGASVPIVRTVARRLDVDLIEAALRADGLL
jgi:hypothetical protein